MLIKYSGLFTNNNTSELNELSNRSIVPLRLVESRFVSFDLSLEPIAVFVFELMLACVVNGASIHPVNRVRANEINGTCSLDLGQLHSLHSMN